MSADSTNAQISRRATQKATTGNSTALDTLIRYCLEDVVNLKPLLAIVYNRMTEGLPFDIAPIAADARPAIPYTADPDLVRDLMSRRAWA